VEWQRRCAGGKVRVVGGNKKKKKKKKKKDCSGGSVEGGIIGPAAGV